MKKYVVLLSSLASVSLVAAPKSNIGSRSWKVTPKQLSTCVTRSKSSTALNTADDTVTCKTPTTTPVAARAVSHTHNNHEEKLGEGTLTKEKSIF